MQMSVARPIAQGGEGLIPKQEALEIAAIFREAVVYENGPVAIILNKPVVRSGPFDLRGREHRLSLPFR